MINTYEVEYKVHIKKMIKAIDEEDAKTEVKEWLVEDLTNNFTKHDYKIEFVRLTEIKPT